jgi:hypothetical protein
MVKDGQGMGLSLRLIYFQGVRAGLEYLGGSTYYIDALIEVTQGQLDEGMKAEYEIIKGEKYGEGTSKSA